MGQTSIASTLFFRPEGTSNGTSRPGRPTVHSQGRKPLVHGPRSKRSPGRATVVLPPEL
jgi:hypothetical protein